MSKYTLLRFSFFRYYSHSLVFSFLIEAAAAVIIRLTAVAAVCRFWSVRTTATVSCTGGAIETYDPSRGAKFETYASLKIRGAIIDYVRKQDWVPRPVRKFARDLDNANTILYNQYDRAPTTAELAEYLQISEEKLLRGMADASNTVTL